METQFNSASQIAEWGSVTASPISRLLTLPMVWALLALQQMLPRYYLIPIFPTAPSSSRVCLLPLLLSRLRPAAAMLSRVMGKAPCAMTAEQASLSPKVVVSTPVGSFDEGSVFACEHGDDGSPGTAGVQRDSSLAGGLQHVSQEGMFDAELEIEPSREAAVVEIPPQHVLVGQALPMGTAFQHAFGW